MRPRRNLGTTDRTVRVVTALLFLALSFLDLGTAERITLVAIAAVLLLTAFLAYCPLYAWLRLNTYRSRKSTPTQDSVSR